MYIVLIVVATAVGPMAAVAQTTFGPQRIVQSTFREGAYSVYAADLDGDGDLDVVSASFNDDKIVWYENTDGMGKFGSQQTITTSAAGPRSVFAADLDGDGDQDVLSASIGKSKIAWYENTDGLGAFGPQQTITTSAPGAWSVFAADLDGDGDFDVLSASVNDNKIAWYENFNGKGAFGPQQTITTSAAGARSVYAADLDGDGDTDVLSASSHDNKIAWYENTDGLGGFGPQQTITTSASIAFSVFAADLDGDGDPDVVSASFSDAKIAWYENTDGLGGFGPQQTITTSANGASAVFAADLDGDGDPDVLSATLHNNEFTWHENMDGLGTFGPSQVIATSGDPKAVLAADLDGDGDQDVLWAGSKTVAWSRNADGQGTFDTKQIIPFEISARAPVSLHATDLDGDGDQDVVSASFSDGKIAWYENLDGLGTFGLQQVITTSAAGARSVYAADLDGDGDLDVLSASWEGRNPFVGNKIAWYENTDGMGAFGPQQIITTSAGVSSSVFAADLDGDGDQDVLSASQADFRIAWYENTDGMGAFGPQQVITMSADHAVSVIAGDLDGDGDTDVLSASFGDDKIAWYENTDGIGAFGPQQAINVPDPDGRTGRVQGDADNANTVFAADLDGDGDLDVLSASEHDDKIAWYENTDGMGAFGPQRVINIADPDSINGNDTNGDADAANSVFATDLDGDGDLDVLSSSASDDKIAWYENTDGLGGFGPQQVINIADPDGRGPEEGDVNAANSVLAADLDGDGDFDVLAASPVDDKIVWYENLTPVPRLNRAGTNWSLYE